MGEVTIKGPGPTPSEEVGILAAAFLQVMAEGNGTTPPEVILFLAREHGEEIFLNVLKLCEVQGYIEKMDYEARPFASAKITALGREFVREVKTILGE